VPEIPDNTLNSLSSDHENRPNACGENFSTFILKQNLIRDFLSRPAPIMPIMFFSVFQCFSVVGFAG
jgi:hypothetical protein